MSAENLMKHKITVKPKQYHFSLIVRTVGWGTKKSAEMAVLAAFAKRSPDGCEFYLSRRAAK